MPSLRHNWPASQAYRDYLVRQYQARLQASRSVGYRPVITTLPTGTSLSAGAVVSPDRRYVRINATPFFSSVGPVYNYNLYNGHTYPVYTPQQRQRQKPVYYYHDGLRTRAAR